MFAAFLLGLTTGCFDPPPGPVEEPSAEPPQAAARTVSEPAGDVLPPDDFEPVRGAGSPPADAEGWERDVTGPWNQGLRLAWSDDGLAFEASGEWIADQSGAPGLAIDGSGRLLASYVAWQDGENFTAVAVRAAPGDWRYYRLKLEGEHGERHNVADPETVALPDGGFRMYYMTGLDGRPAFFSATSDDGRSWVQEAGVRYAPEDAVHAPSVVALDGGWWLYAGPAAGHAAYAPDGLSFAREGGMKVQGTDYFEVHSVVGLSDGRLRAYGSTAPGKLGSAVSADGRSWTLEGGSRWPHGDGFEGIGDVAVVRGDGGWWMVYSEALGTTSSSVDRQPSPRSKSPRRAKAGAVR